MNNELNKYIYTRQFFEIYPEVPKSTFWRWTRTGIRIRNKNKWSKPYILPVISNGKKGESILISLKALYKFFNQIGEQEYALRVPTYSRVK